MEDPSVAVLVSLSTTTFGPERSARLFELLRATWLSQRYWGLAIIASVVAGTRVLGEGWWTSKQRSQWPAGSDLGVHKSPEEILCGPDGLSSGRSNILTHLEYRIAEEVAVLAWGLPVDYVDLNSSEELDRLKAVPRGSSPGDRLVLAYDPGCVVDAVVESRPDNELGTRLDLESSRSSVPAEVWWAWCSAFPHAGPFPLPAEVPSPYDAPLDHLRVAKLRAQLFERGVSKRDAGDSWETARDLCYALARLEDRRFGDLFRWMSRAEAVLDGKAGR